MGLITKPKTASFSDHPDMPCQDPVIASQNFCDEAVAEVERDEAFRKTLEATLREDSEARRSAEGRRASKAEFWLRKMQTGEELDWDEVIVRLGTHDPRSGRFLAKLVAQARKVGALPWPSDDD